MARPKKAPQDKRDESLNPRLTATERARIEAAARLYGLSASDFMRRRALGHRLPASLAEKHREAATATALIRLGVNLNQIAKHVNAGRSAPMGGLADLINRINAELDKIYDPGAGRRPVV
jgi:hypothetical protein